MNKQRYALKGIIAGLAMLAGAVIYLSPLAVEEKAQYARYALALTLFLYILV